MLRNHSIRQSLAINKKNLGEESLEFARGLSNLADLYEKMGNYAAASLCKQALAIKKKAVGEEHRDYAISLNNLATVYYKIGNYDTAEPLLKQALGIIKKSWGEESVEYATSVNNLASFYEDIGNYADAEPLYKLAMAIRKKVLKDVHPDYALSLINIAGLYQTMGNYDDAEPIYKQALEIIRRVLGEGHPYYAANLNNLGILYKAIGNYRSAEDMYKQARDIRRKALGEEHINYAQSLGNLALLYVEMGNYKSAESLYNQELYITRKSLGEEHPGFAICLNNIAHLHQLMGEYAAAEPLYKQALAIYKKLLGEENPDFAGILFNLAALYESMGKYTEAAKYFTLGANLSFNHIEMNFTNLSEAEKLRWWENSKGNFHAAPSLLLTNTHSSSGFLLETFTQQLRLKGFVLSDGDRILKESRKNGSPQLQELLNQWQTNKATLARQYSLPIANRILQLDSLEKQTNEQEKQINQQSVAFRTNKQNQQVRVSSLRQQLKPGEAAVEFIRFEYYHKRWTDSTFYAAFVVTADDTIPHFVMLCEEKQLARLLDSRTMPSEQFVNQFYRGINISNNKQSDGKKSDSLYNLVWKPLLPWLKGIKNISIAPAGLLNRIAFNALPVDSSSYLIDKYQLRQYTSIRQIAEQNIQLPRATVTTDAVLYGGIDFNDAVAFKPDSQAISNTLPDIVKRSISGRAWNSLPGTLKEVNSIRPLFEQGKKSIQVHTGKAATEESFKQLSGHSSSIIHLATHGFSLPDPNFNRNNNLSNSGNQFALSNNPLLRSGVIMAGANRVWSGSAPIPSKEDGILTAYEISSLDLNNTNLVVLSACETALGDIKGTEGVFGLQRAFKLAGVQNMILSLWQVPDKETAELMNLLYTHKLNGMTNYDAFNKAHDSMRKKYPPYYWAAFVLLE